jgi:hypothetical protein
MRERPRRLTLALRPLRRWGRRELRAAPLPLSLALDRPRVLRHSSLVRAVERSRVETRLLERVEREVRTVSRVVSQPLVLVRRTTTVLASGPATREVTVVAPLARTLVRQVTRHERTEPARPPAPMTVAAPRGAPPAAQAATPAEAPAPVPAGAQLAPVTPPPGSTALPGAAVEPLRRPVDAPPPAPDLDAIATQVLRRIERRAIAQRERMGRG